jgi:alkanesulfonate monooxygenase SsuD/methylene tetrahydromethanopterin reductase-like flavin-dependent oxidoreductase (luciferase family)
MDYGHALEFGYFLIPDAGDPQAVLETARIADRLGYDLLAVQDHSLLNDAPPCTRQRAPLGCKPPRTNRDRSRPFPRATLIQPPSLPPTTTIRLPSAE